MQPKLVDEALVQQCPGERRAAHHDEIAPVGTAQLSDPGNSLVARDQRGVVPRQLVIAQGRRDDVLRDRVHLVGERVARPVGPGGRHRLPCAPPEQERVRVAERAGEGAAHDVRVEERVRPAAMGEAAVGVLVGPARRLHDAVEAHELDDYDSHEIRSLGR